MRGQIRNREFASQLRDFSGMRFGNITPTDIDAFLEFGDRVYILIEVKHGAAKMPYGQRLALQRLSDAVGETRPSLLVVARNDNDKSEDVHLHQCRVTEYRSRKTWRIPPHSTTVKTMVKKFLETHGVCF